MSRRARSGTDDRLLDADAMSAAPGPSDEPSHSGSVEAARHTAGARASPSRGEARRQSIGGGNNSRLGTPRLGTPAGRGVSNGGGGLASVRMLNSTASIRAVTDSSMTLGTGVGKGANNIALALDPFLPDSLTRTNPLWAWLLLNLLLILLYAAAFLIAGLSTPKPAWDDNDGGHGRLTIVGWGAHLLGAAILLSVVVALLIKRGPFFPAILTAYLFSLVFFVVGTSLHTNHLGVVSSAGNSTAVLTGDAGSSTGVEPSRLSDQLFEGGSQADLSIQLQWIAALLFWLYFAVLLYRAPYSAAHIPSADAVAKHKLLLELRSLAQFNEALSGEIALEEQSQAAIAAATAYKNATTQQRKATSTAAVADIFTIERPNTAGAAAVSPTFSSPSGPLTSSSALHSDDSEQKLAQALAIQVALEAEVMNA